MTRPHVLFAVAAVIACGGPAAAAASDCSAGDAQVLYALISTPPLLAAQADASTSIEVRSDGCVVVHAPAWRRDAGTRAFSLSESELDRLRLDIAATGIASVDPQAVRADLRQARLQPKSGEVRIVKVSDEPIIELTVTDAAGPKTILWHSLLEDTANHPDHPGLHAIAAAAETLRNVPHRRAGQEAQP